MVSQSDCLVGCVSSPGWPVGSAFPRPLRQITKLRWNGPQLLGQGLDYRGRATVLARTAKRLGLLLPQSGMWERRG